MKNYTAGVTGIGTRATRGDYIISALCAVELAGNGI